MDREERTKKKFAAVDQEIYQKFHEIVQQMSLMYGTFSPSDKARALLEINSKLQ